MPKDIDTNNTFLVTDISPDILVPEVEEPSVEKQMEVIKRDVTKELVEINLGLGIVKWEQDEKTGLPNIEIGDVARGVAKFREELRVQLDNSLSSVKAVEILKASKPPFVEESVKLAARQDKELREDLSKSLQRQKNTEVLVGTSSTDAEYPVRVSGYITQMLKLAEDKVGKLRPEIGSGQAILDAVGEAFTKFESYQARERDSRDDLCSTFAKAKDRMVKDDLDLMKKYPQTQDPETFPSDVQAEKMKKLALDLDRKNNELGRRDYEIQELLKKYRVEKQKKLIGLVEKHTSLAIELARTKRTAGSFETQRS